MSGQRDIQATLATGKQSPVPTEQEAGWAPEVAGNFGKESNFLSALGMEPRIIQPIVWSLHLICCSGSLVVSYKFLNIMLLYFLARQFVKIKMKINSRFLFCREEDER